MKKLIFVFVAIAAISFASCGDKVAVGADGVDTTAVDTLVDTLTVDSVAE